MRYTILTLTTVYQYFIAIYIFVSVIKRKVLNSY